MKLLCMLKYIVKQHNIHVHDNITQFNNSRHSRSPRDFVVQKMVFAYNSKNEIDYKYNCQVPLRWLSCKEFTSHTVDRGSIPGGNRPDSEMTDEPRHSRFGKLKKTSLLLNGYMSSNCRSKFEAYPRYR